MNEASIRPRGVVVGEKRVESAEEVNNASTRGCGCGRKKGRKC